MAFTFTAKIEKVGINPCVNVPSRISKKLTSVKGYIPVIGKISGFEFEQNLCPIKNSDYRLYVNGIMLKGSGTKVGDTVKFSIEQGEPKTAEDYLMPDLLKKELQKNKLISVFGKLIPSRRKEILRYLNFLKTEESVVRNVEKIVRKLKGD